MKIISWNCKFGFTELKASYIEKYNADLYVIQECTYDDIENIKLSKKNCIWYSDNIDSKYGIGIFSDNYKIKLLNEHNNEFRFIIPFEISNKNTSFILFAVWTKDKNKDCKKVEYTEQTWNAINYKEYEKFLKKSIILIGDFNSNNFLDKEYIRKKVPSHNDIINKLKDYGIESAYHIYNNVIDGNENEPTLLWKMDKENKFHIDYCFISKDINLLKINIGTLSEWENTKLSDHCPLIIELELKK